MFTTYLDNRAVRATLSYWVRWQASLEAGWSKKDEQECIDKLLEKWHNQNQEKVIELRALDELLKKKASCSGVAHLTKQWEHQLIHYI